MDQTMLHLSNVPSQAIEGFCRRHRIRRLSLFGSAGRGDFGPESDIDVLVEFEPGTAIGFLALSRTQRELAKLFRRLLDLVQRSGLKPGIRTQILQEEKVLYETP